MALRDLAQKGLLSPGRPLLLLPHPHPTPVQPGHLSPSLGTGNPALFPEDRGPQERGSPGWGAGEQVHKDTHSPGKQTRTRRPTCMHMTQTHRSSPVPGAWEDRFGSGSSSFMPWPFSNLATEGVEMLCAPLPADNKRALGQNDLTLTVGALRSKSGLTPLPGQPTLFGTCRWTSSS